jgi:hypothetical protein
MQERRQSPRRRLQKKLSIINLNSDETIGELVDINPEGMLITSTAVIKLNHSMEMRLLLPVKIFGKSFLDVEARCMWTRQENDNTGFHQCGFEFTEVAPQDVGIIIGLIMEFGMPEE